MMEKRNRALHRTREKNLSEEELKARKDDLRRMQKGIYDQTRVAMERWALFHAERISNMNFNPRMAWASTYILGGGDSPHLQELVLLEL